MPKGMLSISVGLHGFLFAMLYLCPQSFHVGASKGSALTVEIVERASATQSMLSKTGVKIASHKSSTPKKITSRAKKLKKSSKVSKLRKTLLTSSDPKPQGFDLRNLKSSLSPAMKRFFYELRRDIEKHKKYPKKAKRFQQRGEVGIKFSISKNGKITNVVVANPSPFDSLNQSAKSTIIKLLGNSYPLPNEISASQIQVVLPIRYSL